MAHISPVGANELATERPWPFAGLVAVGAEAGGGAFVEHAPQSRPASVALAHLSVSNEQSCKVARKCHVVRGPSSTSAIDATGPSESQNRVLASTPPAVP